MSGVPLVFSISQSLYRAQRGWRVRVEVLFVSFVGFVRLVSAPQAATSG